MPLDTSTYGLGHLRVDGRRWNELRRIHGQISTQAAADGSSYFEMGNTKVICTVAGPQEMRRTGAQSQSSEARIEVEISLAGFSGVERKKRSRNDKRTQEMQHTISSTFRQTLLTQNFPHSTILINLHVLSQDGSLLAACLNACTLALIDAGIPMTDYVAACTTGSTASYASNDEEADPLMDLNNMEELELPFMTLGAVGGEEDEPKVLVMLMETRVQVARLETMLSVGLSGCKQVKRILDGVVKAHGKKVVQARVG